MRAGNAAGRRFEPAATGYLPTADGGVAGDLNCRA